jgi:hypothetical protein
VSEVRGELVDCCDLRYKKLVGQVPIVILLAIGLQFQSRSRCGKR